MDRLTAKDIVAGVEIFDLKAGICEEKAFNLLGQYEQTGLTPAEAAAQKARAEMQEKMDTAAKQQSAAAQAAASAAETRAAELEKRLAIAGDKDTLRFSLLFDGVQRDVNAALALLETMRSGQNKGTATKLAAAMAAMLSQAAACLQKEG